VKLLVARDNKLSRVVNQLEFNNENEVNKKNKDQKTPFYIGN
jgi:hypothetical protein